MNQKKLFEYILLRSLNMNSKEEKITPREIFELIRQTKKADELIIIYDFCAMEKGARFKLAGKKALEEAGKTKFAAALYSQAIDSKNGRKALLLYREAAKKGDPWAALNAGWCYFNGMGTSRNIKMAKKYYSQASKSNIAPAFYNLGLIELDKGLIRAERYFEKAALLGHPRSMLLAAKIKIRIEKRISLSTKRLLKKSFQLGEIEAGDILKWSRRILLALSAKN